MKERTFGRFLLSYGLANGGGFMLIQATVASYFTLFLTDTFGLPAGIAGVLVFVATMLDAVKDPAVGAIVDRTKSKQGRYRPYFPLFSLLFAIFSVLMFLNPQGLSVGQKSAYVMLVYVLYGIALSFCTTAAQAVLPAQTTDTQLRNKAVMFSTMCVAVSFTVASSFTPAFVSALGGYAPLMAIYGALAVAAFLLLYRFSTETYLQPMTERTLQEDLRVLLGHRELFSILVVWCMGSLGYGVMFSASTYYVLYYLARPDLLSPYMLTLSVGALLSMTVGMPLAMRLFHTAQRALRVTQGISAVCYGALLFAGRHLPALFILSFAAAFVSSMQQGLLSILLNDVIDYVQYQDGLSLNGTLSAIKGFASKFGSAFTQTLILLTLSATGYVAGAVGQQPALVMNAINALRFVVPILSAVVLILCLRHYPIEPYYPEIREMKRRMRDVSVQNLRF